MLSMVSKAPRIPSTVADWEIRNLREEQTGRLRMEAKKLSVPASTAEVVVGKVLQVVRVEVVKNDETGRACSLSGTDPAGASSGCSARAARRGTGSAPGKGGHAAM